MLKDPIVVSDAFRTSNISSVKHMNLWSGELYKEVMSWGDNSMAPSPEEDFNNPEIRKRAQRASFKTWNFINDEMAQIERALKVHLFTGYRPITKDSESAPDSMKPASQVQSVESLKSQLKSNNPQQKNVVPLNTTNNEEDQMQQAA